MGTAEHRAGIGWLETTEGGNLAALVGSGALEQSIGEVGFVWRDGTYEAYSTEAVQDLALGSAVRSSAGEVALVGEHGVLQWHRYGRRASVVLIVEGNQEPLERYNGVLPLRFIGEEIFPLWGRRDMRRDSKYREGRIVAEPDYGLQGHPGPETMAALRARCYSVGEDPDRLVWRYLAVVPWEPREPRVP